MVSKAIQSLEETLTPHLQEDESRQTESGSGERKVEWREPSQPRDSQNVTFMQKMRTLRTAYGAKQLPVTIAHESADQVFIDPQRMRIAWVLVGSALCITCLATALMGLTMAPIKSHIWLTVCIISIVLGVTVSSSLKIVVQMIIATVFTKKQYDEPRFACDPRLGMQSELVGDMDHLAMLLERRSRPEYHPIGPHRLMKIHASLARKTCWRTFGGISVVLVLYVLVTLNMFNSWPHCDFWSSDHLIKLIENSAYQPSISLHNLENIGDLNEYLKNALSYSYCRRTWYNGMPLSPPGDKFQKSGWLENFSFRLFGVIQLRLKRSINVKDCLSDKLAKLFPYWKVCIPPLSSATEDKVNYTLGWSREDGEEHKDYTSQWCFIPAGRQSSLIEYGSRGHRYSSGGYFLHLARDLERSQTILWKMEEAGWINSMAKVLFINMCVYNPNIDMISIVIICLEFRETHGIESTIQVLNMKTQNLQLGWSTLPWLFIIPFILWLAARLVFSLLQNGLSYLLSFWNLLDFAVIFMILFNFAMGVNNGLVTKFSLQNYLETGRESFFAYGWVDYHRAPYKCSYVALVVLVTVKLFQHCAVTLRVAPIFLTFRLAGRHVCGVLAITMPLLYVQCRIVESLLFNDRFTQNSSPLVNKVGLKNYASGFTFPDDRLVPFLFCFLCSVVISVLTVILAHHYQMAHHSARRITDQVDMVEAVRASFNAEQRMRAGTDETSFEDALANTNAKLDKIMDSVGCLEHWF